MVVDITDDARARRGFGQSPYLSGLVDAPDVGPINSPAPAPARPSVDLNSPEIFELALSDDLGAMMLAGMDAQGQARDVSWLEQFTGADAAGESHPLPSEDQGSVRSAREVVGSVVSDVGAGLVEAPGQMLGGALDAARGVMSGIAEFDEWVSDGLGLPRLQILDQEGNLDLDLLSPEESEVARVFLPSIGEGDTVTGGLVRGVSQFLVGFVGGARAIGGARTVARAVGASAISDFAAFDGHEARLSDLIQSFPELENPITEFLASDEDHTEFEGRLRNVAEGALSDMVIAGLVRALRTMRSARQLREGTGAQTYREVQERLARDPAALRDLQSVPDVAPMRSDAPLFDFRPHGPDHQIAPNIDLSEGGAAVARDGLDMDGDGTDALSAYLNDTPQASAVSPADRRLADFDEVAATTPNILDEVPAADAAEALTHSRVEAGNGDIFINWSRIDNGEDVASVMQQMADAARDEIDVAGRGIITNAETSLNADQLSAWDILMERRSGDPLNAEASLAARRLWASSGENLVGAARRMHGSATVQNQYLFRRAVAMHQAVQREVIAARRETARALQQWAIPAGSNAEMMRDMSDLLNRFGGDHVNSDFAARIIGLADSGDTGAIDALARRSPLAATSDAVYEFWRSAILSGPHTHMVNGISNTAVAVGAPLERLAASGVGALRGGADQIAPREAGAMLHGLLQSIPDAFRYAGRSFVSGQSGFGLGKVEAPYERAISAERLGNTTSETFNSVINRPVVSLGIDALGSVMSVVGRSLVGADEFFKTMNYRAELHAQAYRQTMGEIDEGRLGADGFRERMAQLIGEPEEGARMEAQSFARYNTFTNDAGQAARSVHQFFHNTPGWRHGLRYIAPFINTVANILRFATERSFAAPLLTEFRADVRAGGRRADMAMARFGLGSFAMLGAMDLYNNGQLTGAGPSNRAERATWRRTGWQPYSVRIGDRYYAYNRIDPLGWQFGVAAELAEMSANAGEDLGQDYDELVYRTIGAVGQNLTDKSYFRGLSEFFTAMSDPDRYADRFLERFAGSFIPNAVRTATRIQDPVMRRTTDTLENFRARIPGLSDDLPARRDVWGREISFQSGLGAAYDATSPIYSSAAEPTPIDTEMMRIGQFIGMPSQVVRGQTLRNLPEVYEDYVILQGATPASELPTIYTATGRVQVTSTRLEEYGDMTLFDTLNALVEGNLPQSEEYATAAPEEQGGMIRGIVTDFRTAARLALMENHPDIFNPGGL